MFRFIGGPARCGRSTLAKQAEMLHTDDIGQSVSLDYLRYALATTATDELKRTLLIDPSHAELGFDAWLAVVRKCSDVTWQAARGYLNEAKLNGDNVLMEGSLWPDQVTELEVAYRAVFLVDTSPNLAERLIVAARDTSTHNNWQRHQSDEWIKGWADYNIERSHLYKRLAQEHEQQVFDIADSSMQQVQCAALGYLFADTH